MIYNILDTNKKVELIDRHNDVIIVAYLYYKDSFEKYFLKIIRYAPRYSLCFVTSSEELYERMKNTVEKTNYSNISILLKENRGRDVSSLLVTATDIIKHYKYFCFFHDKAPKTTEKENFVSGWEKELFENTIYSEMYIEQVVSLFEDNPELGLAIPPEPLGRYWYTNTWLGNYLSTCDLAKRLSIDTEIKEESNPVSLGTVFWARVCSLDKLLNYGWRYEDFPSEPLPSDGTISHAIERIFPYIVQDAGYDIQVIMTSQYSGPYINDRNEKLADATRILDSIVGVSRFEQLDNFFSRITAIKDFCSINETIYIYGTGVNGQACARLLNTIGISFKGFVVSKKVESRLEKYPIFSLDESIVSKAGYLIAVGETTSKEIVNILKEKNCFNYLCV